MQTNNRPVVCAGVGFEDAARQLAGSLGLEFSESPQTGELRLTLDADGLSLGDCARNLSSARYAERARRTASVS